LLMSIIDSIFIKKYDIFINSEYNKSKCYCVYCNNSKCQNRFWY